MDDTLCRRFFLEPTQAMHRRYAALHAFFIEGLSCETIAEQFGFSYHTVRSWVRDFRSQCQAGRVPPFSRSRNSVGRATTTPPHHRPKRPRSPTAAR